MPDAKPPSISVIVCSYNRPDLLRRALAAVFRQDTTDYEVILIDDGSDEPVTPPAKRRKRVRLIRTEHRGVGAARATGLDAARGEFIAYCDDDDEWTPNHLSILLQALLDDPDIALVYGDAQWVRDGEPPTTIAAPEFDADQLGNGNYIFASDVMHRSSAARRAGGFDAHLPAHEDWDLWLRMSRLYGFRHVPVVVGTHHQPADRVSATEHPADRERVSRYHAVRRSIDRHLANLNQRMSTIPVPSFDPSTWRPGRRELIWQSLLFPTRSYGTVGHQLLLAVERHGIDVTLAPVVDKRPPSELARFARPLDHWAKLGFHYDYRVPPRALRCERLVQYTMHETKLVPPALIQHINQAATLLYVPCQQNAESFQDCGVRVPVKVLHHGVDATQFPYLTRHRTGSEPFTFGTFGDLTPRKGIDVLLRAFRDEFTHREHVRLLLKGSSELARSEAEDPRVTVVTGFLDNAALLDLLRQMDVFVLPSRGEGFGLCGLEAMATGLPTIATNWSGPTEYLDPVDSFPLAYRLVEAHGTAVHAGRYFGRWAEPDYEHLRALLRWLYEHPAEAAAKGRAASHRVHTHWTWDRIARQLCDDLDAIARGISPT